MWTEPPWHSSVHVSRVSLNNTYLETEMLSKSFHSVSTHTKFVLASVIQAERMAGRPDGCLKEKERAWIEKEIERERGVETQGKWHISSTSSLLPSTSLNSDLVMARIGHHQLAATCQVKLQNQTIKLWHVLYWKMITWPPSMDNPLKADQRKSKCWSGLQCLHAHRAEAGSRFDVYSV